MTEVVALQTHYFAVMLPHPLPAAQAALSSSFCNGNGTIGDVLVVRVYALIQPSHSQLSLRSSLWVPVLPISTAGIFVPMPTPSPRPASAPPPTAFSHGQCSFQSPSEFPLIGPSIDLQVNSCPTGCAWYRGKCACAYTACCTAGTLRLHCGHCRGCLQLHARLYLQLAADQQSMVSTAGPLFLEHCPNGPGPID